MTGTILIKTQYVYVEPPVENEPETKEKEKEIRNFEEFPLNKNC